MIPDLIPTHHVSVYSALEVEPLVCSLSITTVTQCYGIERSLLSYAIYLNCDTVYMLRVISVIVNFFIYITAVALSSCLERALLSYHCYHYCDNMIVRYSVVCWYCYGGAGFIIKSIVTDLIAHTHGFVTNVMGKGVSL